MQGKIFNIQRFCVNDGPGIRTTVFYEALGKQRAEILVQTEDQIEKIIDYIASKTDKPVKKA